MGIRIVKEPYFEKQDHTYLCGIVDDIGNIFIGEAKCHPDDQDLESELVGYLIASKRAVLRILKHHVKNELKPTLKTFNHLYDSMRQSKHFNYKSYEAKRIYRTIKDIEEEINTFKEMIKNTEEELKEYIISKDNLRTKIREMRAEDENK